MTNVERLREKFDAMKASGTLIDLKVSGPNLVGANLERLCGEVLEMLEIYESGRWEPIDDKLV